jgi:hypothetical protein
MENIYLSDNINDSSSVSDAKSVGDSTTGIRYNSDYNLISLNFLGSNFPVVDLQPLMLELSYFEDIFSNVVSGQVVINDALGMIENLEIHGNEYVRMAFAKDGSKLIIDKIFRVYKISSRTKTSSPNDEVYVIHFCSDELILSSQYKISKSYKNQNISQIVNDILKVKLKVSDDKYDPRNIETTKGQYSFIVPNFSPFEAINWLSMYAQSASPGTIGSDMILYEDKDGFNFKSLQSLFQQNPYFLYEYRPKNMTLNNHLNESSKQVFNVIGYEFINSFNSLENISRGTYANRVLTVDPLLRRYAYVDFNYKDYAKNAEQLNKHEIVNNLKNRFGDTLYETPQSCYKLAITNKGQTNIEYIKGKPDSVSKDISSETFLTQRKAQLSLANYTKIKLSIAGDPNITVGKTINFDLFSISPTSKNETKDLDKFYSGKYLVTAIRHIIKTGEYITILEIAKDSVPTQYSSVDNSSSTWKNTVAGVKK